MRTQAGITEHRLTIIKQLNPDLKNVNKIRPGQVIILPEREKTTASEGQDTETYTIRRVLRAVQGYNVALYLKGNIIDKHRFYTTGAQYSWTSLTASPTP